MQGDAGDAVLVINEYNGRAATMAIKLSSKFSKTFFFVHERRERFQHESKKGVNRH